MAQVTLTTPLYPPTLVTLKLALPFSPVVTAMPAADVIVTLYAGGVTTTLMTLLLAFT